MDQKHLIIGITGGIACGKSEVGMVLQDLGFLVCDADKVAHRLLEKGTAVYQQIVKAFGSEILQEDGSISRARLGALVFADSEKREQLNQLVHPAVRAELLEWISEQRKEERDAAVLLPLLFESGMDDLGWDCIWSVSAPEEVVLERLKRRGFDEKDARRRIKAQWSQAEKDRRAEKIILNSGTRAALRSAVEKILNQTRVEV